jgi:hypothetical protein
MPGSIPSSARTRAAYEEMGGGQAALSSIPYDKAQFFKVRETISALFINNAPKSSLSKSQFSENRK